MPTDTGQLIRFMWKLVHSAHMAATTGLGWFETISDACAEYAGLFEPPGKKNNITD